MHVKLGANLDLNPQHVDIDAKLGCYGATQVSLTYKEAHGYAHMYKY